MTSQRAAFAAIADRVEAELRGLGAWTASPPSPEALETGGAFGLQSMAFTQWLQFVLVPRLRAVAAGTSDPPTTSQVHAQAIREFDGWAESQPLQDALLDLDVLVESGR